MYGFRRMKCKVKEQEISYHPAIAKQKNLPDCSEGF